MRIPEQIFSVLLLKNVQDLVNDAPEQFATVVAKSRRHERRSVKVVLDPSLYPHHAHTLVDVLI